MSPSALLSLLQFSDGLFPVGGYAYSFGLESYVQAGVVKDPDGVDAFLRHYLEGTAGPCDASAMICALALGEANDVARCVALDQTLDDVRLVEA